MNSYLLSSILIFLIFGTLQNVFGYQWVSLTFGDTLPANAFLLQDDYSYTTKTFIGRARHFNEILPAAVSKDGNATISSCKKVIHKDEFEILTTDGSEFCEWKLYSDYNDLDDNVVRGGTASNGEPIFIGKTDTRDGWFISSIYLTGRKTRQWRDYSSNGYYRYLSCDIRNKWVDTSSIKIPNNTISGGKSGDGMDIYVARLKEDCEIVTGQVIPSMETSMAYLYDDRIIESDYCQVLVGESNEYTWISADSGVIPEYAVVNGKWNTEPAYVARFNKNIRHLTYSEAIKSKFTYDILVKNPNISHLIHK